MSGQNNMSKSLKDRRRAAGLELSGPMPEVVIDRAVAEKHNLLLPSPMPRGIRSHYATPMEGSINYHREGLVDDTGATLTYGSWASNLQAPAREATALQKSDTSITLSSATPGPQQQQNLNLAVAPADDGGVAESIDWGQWLVFPDEEEEEGALPAAPSLEPPELVGSAASTAPPPDSGLEQTTTNANQITTPFELANMSGQVNYNTATAADMATSSSSQTLPVHPRRDLEPHVQNTPDQARIMSQPGSSATDSHSQPGSSVTVGDSQPSSLGTVINLDPTPDEPLMARWTRAVGLVDDNTIKLFIRACFCAGRRAPISLIMGREVVVGEMTTRLMSDLRVLEYQTHLAKVFFRPPCSLQMPSISPAQLGHFQLLVQEDDGRQIIRYLLEKQRYGQPVHPGRIACSHACRSIVEIMKPSVQVELDMRRPQGWEYFDELLGALARHFIDHMIPHIAVFGSYHLDQETVQLLAHYTNRVAFWFLLNKRLEEAKNLAERSLYLIRTAAISPPSDWHPRAFRHMYDFDLDIKEYKTVIYRRQKGIATRILVCVQHRKMPGGGFLKNLPDMEVYDFDNIEEDPEPSIWDLQGGDPAGMLD